MEAPVFTAEDLLAHMEMAGLALPLDEGADGAARDGKASSEEVSRGAEDDWTFLAAGLGAWPRVGKGSGAPSSSWCCWGELALVLRGDVPFEDLQQRMPW